jgi:AcrR family transcriptional regulator
MTASTQRNYGGLSAESRQAKRRQQLLETGLELLGTLGMPGLTVRGVLDHAQLAPRYFYENFANIDELAVAVFEEVLMKMTQTGLAAVSDSGPGLRARVRAGLDAVARLLTEDPRKGRVLLVESVSSPVLAPLRHDASRSLAQLVAQQADDIPGDPAAIAITARFLVGGFSETLAALTQDGGLGDRDVVVDRCTDLFLACVRR